MKGRLLLALQVAILLMWAFPGFTQTLEYGFASEMGTYTPITGGLQLGADNTDDQRFVDPATPLGGTVTSGPGLPIGFNFVFNGATFDRLAINANGWISLGQSALTPSVNITSSSSYLPISSTSVIDPAVLYNRVVALARDLQAQAGAAIRVETIGAAPNRICVVQWENFKKYGTSGTGDNLNFQIQLHETTNNVKIVYGAFVANATAGNMQVGLRGPDATDFNARQGTGPWTETTAASANNQYVVMNDVNFPPNGLTFSFNYPVADSAPNPANLVSPTDGATLVSPFTSLNWLSGGGLPDGFRLNFGTNNPPTNIVQNLDLGASNSYTPDPELAISTTYYWQVVPYNTFGNATNCPVWSFTTHGDATVDELPYTQNWDSVTDPELPFDWTAIVQSTNTAALVATSTTTPHSAPNNLRLYNSSDTAATLMLVAPEISQAIPISTVRVKAWLRSTSTSNTMDIGVMTNPTDPSTFESVQTISFANTTYSEYSIPLSSYTGTGRFIAFKHGMNGSSRNLYVDDVTFEAIAPNDLAALALAGNTTPSVGSPTVYTVSVLNNGTATQNAYSVKLMSTTGAELASVAGPSITAGETIGVQIPWTPTVEGSQSIYGKVVLAGDVNSINDESPIFNITVQPEGVFSVTIGEGNLAEGIPYEFFYKNSLFQCLYYSTEIGMFGNITAVNFYNNFVTDLVATPIKLWLGTTMEEDLSVSWIDPTTLTLVYDGTMNFPTGTNTITIPLQAPFSYTGGNLVLYANRPMDTQYYSSSDNFEAQTLGTNRARKLVSDSTTYDPMAPSAAGTLSGTFPKATFMMTPLSPNPIFAVNPPEKDFGLVILGESPQQTFNIANAGGGTLGVNSISISGDPAFTLSGLPTLPQALVTGQTTSFEVIYSPTTAGEHSAVVTITDDITRQTHTVQLDGEGFDATITTLPATENWDGAVVPNFPLGWSIIHNSTATSSYLRTSTSSPFSAPNCVQMANSTDANAQLYLISPPIDNAIPMNTLRVRLMAKGGTNYVLQIGTMSNSADPTTFAQAEELNVITGWNEYVVNLSNHTAAGHYIAVRHGLGATSRTLWLDDVTLELISPNDLAAMSVTGNPTPSVGAGTNYEVTVYNNGTATQTDYQVQIVNAEGTVLASAAGASIAPDESLSTSLTVTPTVEGPMALHGKVVLTGDVNPVNDLSPALNIVVMPEDIVMITVGTGDQLQGVPWDFYYKNSIHETIYLQSELGIYGLINSLTFYNNFTTNLENTPIKIWLGTTDLADLSGGWILPAQMTLVYDGTINLPSGQNSIVVPLQNPFNYFSGNLVMMANRPMDTQYYNSADDFLGQTVGTNRSRKLQSDSTVYDPLNPSAAGTLSGIFAKTSFGFILDGIGSLSGTVTSGGTPLEGVEIQISDSILNTTTSVTGQYSFPYLLEGAYNLTAHKVGYEDQTLPFTIVEDEETIININMIVSSTVAVTGTIVGSDNPGVGLDEAVINLSGVLDYSATTNALGQFTIPDVLSGNTYNYSIMRAGYQNESGTIVVASTAYDMGTITLSELTLPPVGVQAVLNTAETAVNITWRAPGQPGTGLIFDFEGTDGGWEASSNWTEPLGDWEHTSAYDVANWAPTYTGTSIVPPPLAHSGTGMWGTKINTNYTNSGGFNYLTKTFNFGGLTNTHMRFWSWENVFGNFDYAQVSVNGTLVWGPSWDYSGTQWQERIIDLSAYDGLPEVEIQFQMYASTVVNYAGWYIDDVEIASGDFTVRTSDNPIMPVAFKGLSEIEAAQLAERLAALRPASNRSTVFSAQTQSRVPVGYHVFKLMQGQETQQNLWTQLTTTAITDTAFTAPGWNDLPNGEHKWAVKTVYTNDVISNPAISNMLRKWPNDLSALSISGNTTPTVSSPSEYTVRIKNTGTSAQAAGSYTVKIFSDTNELASVSGPAIAVNEEVNVAVTWTPMAEGTQQIHGKVVLPGDLTPDNDTTDTITVLVMPVGQFGYTVGIGDELARTPIDMYYKGSLFQGLYFNPELGNFMGFLNAIQFYNNFVTDLPNMPTKIWITTTTLDDLSENWVPVDSTHTLVFDGTVNYPTGENTITIPFIEPYMYLNGQNLLVTVLRPLDTQYYSSNDRFKAQTIGTNRARKIQSDSTVYDPAVPPAPTTSQLTGQFPMTTFLGIPGGVGHLSGLVTGIGNQPLADVLVHIDDTGYQAMTDQAGEYQIQYILPGNYTVTFSTYGYITQTLNVTIVEDETATLNANIAPMPTVNVTGTVLASDTGGALAGAAINLEGYADYTTNTNATGVFTIAGVYANQSYSYQIMAAGYTSQSGTLDVGATNLNMGNITLNEIAYAPHGVTAELNDTYTNVNVSWLVPDPTAIEITQSFEDAIFPPEDWGQVITNSGAAGTNGVYPTFSRLGTITNTPTNIIPSHGSFQTGLWWSYEHQDEWLLSPSFVCPPDAYMTFDSYVFLGSENNDHYYVKVSTNNGDSWTVLWDATTQTGGWNYYDSPFTIDLSAYSGLSIILAFNAEDPPSNDGLWYTWFMDNIYIGNVITAVTFNAPSPVRINKSMISHRPVDANIARDGSRPNMENPRSITLRNTRANDRLLTGYNVYRLISGQENNEASWVQVNDELVTTTNITDEAWEGLANGTYRWGVKAIYTAGVASGPAFSNPLVKENQFGTIVGFVRRTNNQGIANATVTAGEYSATTNNAGAYSLILPIGIYDVTASATGFDPRTMEDVVVSPNQNTTLNIILEPTSNEDELSHVTATALRGNMPNPFNPETTIRFDILEPCQVTIDVFNLKGQKVRSLLSDIRNNGRHSVVFDARDDRGNMLSSGVYFYRFTAGQYTSTKKMLLME